MASKDTFESGSENDESTKFVKDELAQVTKWNAKGVEVDSNMLKGRKEQRGFTINMGKANDEVVVAERRKEKRAQTLPTDISRRADFVISEEGERVLQQQADILGARFRRGSVSCYHPVVPEAVMTKTWEDTAHLFTCGKMTQGQTHGDEREVEMCAGDRFPVSVPPVITCVKGSKGIRDTAPNQDNFSVLYLKSGMAVACCMDGHGPFGHLVATHTVKTVPYYLINSMHFPDDMRAAFHEAFLLSQKDIVAKALEEGWDVQASGSTAACAAWKGDKVWTAHAGDSRIIIGTEETRQVVFETTDHKPDTPAEKKRIEDSGGEVRSQTYADGWTVHRIFVRGHDFPGLAMARTLGDASVKEHGVTADPEVSEVTVDLSQSPFMILASDGVWEFLESDFVAKAVAKKMATDGAQKTVVKLQRESKKRWRQEEGDYCDDICAILIQLK